MKKLLLLISAALLLLAGCDKKQSAAYMKLDKTALLFDREGNAPDGRIVNVSSSIDWLAKSDQSWCTVSPLSTRGSAEVTVNVTQNNGFANRTATITLQSVGNDIVETITVTQSKNDYIAGVNPGQLDFNFDASPGASGSKFTIAANADWGLTVTYPASSPTDWITLSQTEGSGAGEIAVEVEANEDPANARQATIVLTVGDQQTSVMVKQANEPELAQGLITAFNIENHDDIEAAIDQQAGTIALTYIAPYADIVAAPTLSTWADITPDPATPRSYETPVEFTVTSYDGKVTKVYTVFKQLPPKRASGIRPGSAILLWAKKLNADLAIPNNDMTTGIAATGDYVVLNTRNAASTYLNAATGEKVGTISLGAAVTGSLVNFYNTADEAGNILINNLVTGSGDFKIWKLSSVTGTPELFLTYSTSVPLGRKISVKGSLDGNAIITSGVNSAGSTFARWKVTNGVLDSATPEFITISGGYTWSNNNVDVVHSSASDLTADYFAMSYSNNRPSWVSGSTNAPLAQLPAMDANYVGNAIDYAVFNGVPYILFNHANSFTWGTADEAVLAEASSVGTFTGTYTAAPVVGGAVQWVSPAGVYGGFTTSGVVNGNSAGDVALRASGDGYYLYAYFMFTNGQVVCYRFDSFVDQQ